MRFIQGSAIAAVALIAALVLVPSASAKKRQTLEVCKQGCEYRTIQDAVDDSRKNAIINVAPGKYKEGVIVQGHKHDGLTIQGTKKNPKKVILEGKNARGENGLAQNGIEGIKVDGLKLKNMWARNYVTNGFFLHECADYLMKNLRASFNRSYGFYAFHCKGGRMTKSVGYGHGDSAFYVGETPPQKKPKWTKLDHLDGNLNVLGYSGTNSRYVKITQSNFYNNGAGVVPNTLDSELFEPAENGIIKNNNIFWNNFNYFAPGSPVQTVSSGLGEVEGVGTINFPTGVGVITLGATGWIVENNNIFGNYKWGYMGISNPFNEGDQAVNRDNQVLNNQMGRGGTDTNGYDIFSDGSGSGNCYQGNDSSTFDPSGTASNASLYPPCPAPPPPASGTGTSDADSDQFTDLAIYVTSSPPEKQQCSWTIHEHPPFENYEPYEVPGVTCP